MKKITLMVAVFAATFSMKAQEDCTNAEAIAIGTNETVNMEAGPLSGTPIGDAACVTATDGTTAATVADWYSITTEEDMIITINTSSPQAETDYFPVLHILTGTCEELACFDADYPGNEDSTPNVIDVEFLAEAGTTYYVVYDDLMAQLGSGTNSSFTFDVISSEVPDAPTTYASNPTPENGATDVPVDGNTGPNGEAATNNTPFAFDAPEGETVTSYLLFFVPESEEFPEEGQSAPAAIADGDYVFQNLEANTTYKWKVVPANAGGSADVAGAPVWTFTTGAILDVDNFEMTKDGFTHFNNNEVLEVTAQQTIGAVTLFNLLGQQVANQEVNGTKANVNIASLNAGIYLAQVQVEGKTQSFKFVKK